MELSITYRNRLRDDSILIIITNDIKVSHHCLMKLSTTDWNRSRINSIHLTSSCIDGGKRHYNDVLWDENIIPQKRLISNNSPLCVKEVNLSRIKYKYFLIAQTKNELEEENNIIYMDSATLREIGNGECTISGIVVLGLFVYDNQKSIAKRQWVKNQYKVIITSKRNIIQGNSQYFGSEGINTLMGTMGTLT